MITQRKSVKSYPGHWYRYSEVRNKARPNGDLVYITPGHNSAHRLPIIKIRAFQWSEKDRLNIDIYRGFIERFGLFLGQ